MSVVEITIFTLIIIISLLSKIPFISINMLLPFSEGLIWTCVVCNVISWFLLEVWALGLDIGFFLKEGKITTISGFFTALIIVGLALISQIPNIFPAIEYNPKVYSIYIAICVLLALSFFPIKSLILTTKKIHNYFYLEKEHRLCLEKGEDIREYILSFPREVKLGSTISPDYIYNNTKLHGKCLFSLGNLIGLFIIICYEWFNAEYSYIKTKEFIYDNEAVAIILSVLIVITTFYLTGLSVIRMINNITNTIFSCNYTFEYESFKLLYYLLQVIVFVSSIFSVGVYYVVVTNFYIDDYTEKVLLTSTVCLTIFVILETGSSAMVTYFIELLIAKYGSDDDKKILHINNMVRHHEFDSKFTKEEYVPVDVVPTEL